MSVIEFGHMLWAYMLTCIAVSAASCLFLLISFLFVLAASDPGNLGTAILVSIVVSAGVFIALLIVALPGFAVLRCGLWQVGRHDPASFATAGALNAGVIALALDDRPVLLLTSDYSVLIFAGLGAAAGAFQWWAERRSAHRAPSLRAEAA